MEFKDSHYIAIIFNEFQSFIGGHIWIWGSMFMSWLIVTLTFVPLDTWKKKVNFDSKLTQEPCYIETNHTLFKQNESPESPIIYKNWWNMQIRGQLELQPIFKTMPQTWPWYFINPYEL